MITRIRRKKNYMGRVSVRAPSPTAVDVVIDHCSICVERERYITVVYV